MERESPRSAHPNHRRPVGRRLVATLVLLLVAVLGGCGDDEAAAAAAAKARQDLERRLEAEQKRRAEQEQIATERAALDRMRLEHHAARGITWVQHGDFPRSLDRSAIGLYFGVYDRGGGVTPLRLRIQYGGDRPLELQRFTLEADGAVMAIPAGPEIGRDAGAGRHWEWYDQELGRSQAAISRVMNAAEATLRYEGRLGSATHPVSAAEKSQMREILEAHAGLKALRLELPRK